jgi:superoxide reductase
MVENLRNPANNTPSCCGEKMTLLSCNTTDGAKEKHVPIVSNYTTAENGYKTGILVSVGSNPHPMEKDHYIEWIEVIDNNRVMRVNLAPGDKPEAFFEIKAHKGLIVRAYCNKHNLWSNG